MLRKSQKVVCAWISLMLEKHRKNYPFEMKDILFTRAEIHRRTEEIFREEISDYIVKQITIGGPVTSRDVFFLTGRDNAFKLYHWLCCPDECTGYNVEEVVDALERSYWNNRTPYTSRASIMAVLERYYTFVRGVRIPVQEEENPEIISREAVWMAVATLTYNDYIRTGSHNAASYNYPSNVVGLVAHSFNTHNTTSTCSTMAWNSCTVGVGEQPWSYLVDTGGVRRDSRRRLSYYGEFEYTQPDLHDDFKINTVTGILSVKQLNDFIKNVFSPIFYKRLMPPLDTSHSLEEMTQHALQMDYDSLRAAAVGRGELHPEQRMVTSSRYERDPYIAVYAKERANGVCQLCHQDAPFRNSRGEPYLETHHIIWLSEGGADAVDNVVALCPNCHRKMHIVNDDADVRYLQKLVLSGK